MNPKCPACGDLMLVQVHGETLRVWACACGWRRVETGYAGGAPVPKRRMTFAEAAAERRR